MDKNLSWKIILIIGLVAIAAWTLYPPDKTLKKGIDLGGGTSLIYEIDAHGMNTDERRGLASRMITVLRRRIDPANIQNLVWRPQGNTRFEIQMPLASAEAREKREAYEGVFNALLAENVTTAAVLRAVAKDPNQRAIDFTRYAHDSSGRLEILNEFAEIYDKRRNLQQQRDELAEKMALPEEAITRAALDIDDIKSKAIAWAKLDKDKLKETLTGYLATQVPQKDTLDQLVQFVEIFGQWAQVVDALTEQATGVNTKYNEALRNLHKLNLSEDQITFVLEAGKPGSYEQRRAIEALKGEFPEREKKIDAVVTAYKEYFDFRGRLDDPGDLQRMLKGAGILEFRILPTEGHAEVDMTAMKTYVENLKAKGPKYASDDKYIWFEVENQANWRGGIYADFGNKRYVLASNRKGEAILHSGQEKDWRLVRASPGQDSTGRRSINFQLDIRGGQLFSNVTGNNINRPLAILLDNVVISAPNIQSRISTHGQITGGQNGFSQTEVEDMVSKLNAGSLPARLVEQPISVRTIGPSIGADNSRRGIIAGLIGLACVMLCMLVYYLKAGSIADIALVLNLLFTLSIMAGLRATFTLPGIAGVILTIGMSVDANVLIFERIREEQQRGASMAIAVKNGYHRAFSAIFDSNITTIITAAILYWIASEDIKGFALTLMLGLASSLFTALFVTRAVFNLLLKHKLIKDRLLMLQLIRKPNIDWMKYRPVFFAVSGILAVGGLAVFLSRDNSKYDIEFTGGTSVQIDFKSGVSLSRQEVEDMIHQKGVELQNDDITAATVYSVGDTGQQFEINTRATNRTIATITLPAVSSLSAQDVVEAIRQSQGKLQGELGNLSVTPAGDKSFVITTTQLNTKLIDDVLEDAFPDASVTPPEVDAVVTDAVLAAFQDKLEILQDLQPVIVLADKITELTIEPRPELGDFLGGVAISCRLGSIVSGDEIEKRFSNLRFKPDMRELSWFNYKLLDSQFRPLDANKPADSFVYISTPLEAQSGQEDEELFRQFVDNEKTKVTAAMQIETSLSQVTQISPSVGKEAQRQALVAIVLSLIAMLIYLAVRFGDLRYGIGAVVKLAHDTLITLGMVSVCVFIAATAIGRVLLIGDFKFDMTMIAAFLTLLGYSINDSIVIYDRIRENRRQGQLSPQIINNSINDCMSRTLLTGMTTLLVLLIMYIFGGKVLRGFNFTMLFGIIIGTYSSVAISVPILLLSTRVRLGKRP
ncbi:MAG: protein translocase subunit SecD [Sedimentisphaerales bacterium]|nr:protein translocase subunit SecD [Sedimentisphaerales bacterium]